MELRVISPEGEDLGALYSITIYHYNMDKQKERVSYKNYGFRLNKKTFELLKSLRKIDGKSWNLFIYSIAEEHVNNNKNRYRNDIFKPIYSKFKKNCCELCLSIDNLCVHHKDGNLVNCNEKNLQTLCNKCHGKQYPR